MGQSRPVLFIFFLFSLQFQYKLKKHRWCAWDLNPGPQDGRRRRNHGAMAATITFFVNLRTNLVCPHLHSVLRMGAVFALLIFF